MPHESGQKLKSGAHAGPRVRTLAKDSAQEADDNERREGLEAWEEIELDEVLHEGGGHGHVELEAVVDQERCTRLKKNAIKSLQLHQPTNTTQVRMRGRRRTISRAELGVEKGNANEFREMEETQSHQVEAKSPQRIREDGKTGTKAQREATSAAENGHSCVALAGEEMILLHVLLKHLAGQAKRGKDPCIVN